MIASTPWIERKFDFHFPPGLFPIIVERLRGTIPQLQSMLDGLTDSHLSRQANGKWSVKEIVGHLFDLEELWIGRIEDFINKKESLRAADMTNSKTHAALHNEKPVIELLDQFNSARKQLIARVEELDETIITRTALHPRLKQPMRLVDSLFFTAEHDDHELTKIRFLIARNKG